MSAPNYTCPKGASNLGTYIVLLVYINDLETCQKSLRLFFADDTVVVFAVIALVIVALIS